MFRPLLGHFQALWENRSKSYLHFNVFWGPGCLQIVIYECEINNLVYIGSVWRSQHEKVKNYLR